MRPQVGKLYKHRDGGLYVVRYVGRNSDDCKQEMVVYESLQDSDFPKGTIWIKPLTSWSKPGRFELHEPDYTFSDESYLQVMGLTKESLQTSSPFGFAAKIAESCINSVFKNK